MRCSLYYRIGILCVIPYSSSVTKMEYCANRNKRRAFFERCQIMSIPGFASTCWSVAMRYLLCCICRRNVTMVISYHMKLLIWQGSH